MLGIARHTVGDDHFVLNPFTSAEVNSELARACGGLADYRAIRCARAADVPKAAITTQRALSDYAPDVVHVHLFHAMVAVATVLRTLDAPAIVSHHHGSRYVDEHQRWRAALDRLCVARFDRIVAVSQWTARFLLDEYGLPEDKVVTIVNGWEGHPEPARGHDRPTLVCVANLRRQKGHEIVLEACHRLLPEFPDLRLVVVGDGERRSELETLATRLGVAHAVEWRGHVDVVWPILAEADVFVLASHYEPLGVAVLEGMAAGLPVVAHRVGGIPELVEHGVTGELVSPGDVATFTERVASLLRAPDRRSALGRQGQVRAGLLTMREMAARYRLEYARLLPGGERA